MVVFFRHRNHKSSNLLVVCFLGLLYLFFFDFCQAFWNLAVFQPYLCPKNFVAELQDMAVFGPDYFASLDFSSVISKCCSCVSASFR